MNGAVGISIGIISLLLLIQPNQTQLTPDEVDPGLKYIVTMDLDTWEPLEELSKNLPYYLSGFDYENRPIWIVEFGKWDLRHYVDKGKKWEKLVDKYFDKLLYRLYNSTWIKGTEALPVKDGVLIVDFEGFSVRQISSPPALNFFLNKMRTIVLALPLAHDVFVVNVNFLARNLMEMLRPIIGRDFHRVEMFGTNPQSYKPAFLRILPPDQIPEWYGGSKGFKPITVYG